MINRREFTVGALAAGSMFAKESLDAVLKSGVSKHGIPLAAAMVAGPKETLWSGAVNCSTSGLFQIASMTKPLTTAAALQLVEQGKVTIDEPVSKHLPQLADLQVLESIDASGKAVLRPAKKPVTLRHLMTHTAGFAYDNWDALLFRYLSDKKPAPMPPPLVFDPGAKWEYGTNIDWIGRLVEKISGMDLESYFQKNILGPLGMKDTSYIVTEQTYPRLVPYSRRDESGALKQQDRPLPAKPTSFNGGGGLYSTVADYVRFMQMILNDGAGVLKKSSVAMMKANQTGTIPAGRLKTARPSNSADVDFHPGHDDRFTFGFLMNPEPHDGGRSAGSLAWAGIQNTFFWIDPKKKICATIMMQFYPFVDPAAMAMLREFERAVYASL